MRQLLYSAVFLTAISAFGQNDMQTVATVRLTKTESITVKQLKIEVDNIQKATGKTLNNAERREVLDSMINQRLALQAADRDRVSVSDAEVNQQINEFRSQLAGRLGRNPTESEFADAIRQQ
ncbi:MAG: SurA N-terminal domain-containing protein, partial [Spirochaetaceae bacterium]|nr:SurA N-terminal domain-containing protein [Spirochaetaceae bacterium]